MDTYYYGYALSDSYMGRMPDGSWQKFPTEQEYKEAFDEAIGAS